MQAIETRYHGPTNNNGSRISARCDAGRIIVGWDHALDTAQNHAAAAKALATKLGWLTHGLWVGGSLPGNHTGYAFVCGSVNGCEIFGGVGDK